MPSLFALHFAQLYLYFFFASLQKQKEIDAALAFFVL